tara:strand:- start:291 stop:467 length:177 start_codon:yes stop_codon:yes gene_type:complete
MKNGAKRLAIAGTIATRAAQIPKFRKPLLQEILRLSKSPKSHHRKFAALHADLLDKVR